ncbi:MAG TPA: hypothetical protein PKE45_11430, partial [Caldilineaceae bacterium]|nr:hypothetical protein [Caldilineaceae bacterium]
MAPDSLTPEFHEKPDDQLLDLDPEVDFPAGPSLPIILFSAACGIGAGVIIFYVAYRMLFMSLPLSAGVATLFLLGTLSLVAGLLSALTRSNPVANIVFGCGLIALTATFFAFCSLVGAL